MRRPRAGRAVVAAIVVVALGPAAPTPEAIVGGHPVGAGRLPWMVAVVRRGQDAFAGQFCGGTLISPRAVLTAAHCLRGERRDALDVLAGRVLLTSRGGDRVAVSRALVDPAWRPRTGRSDAAVLLLSRPLAAPPLPLATAAQADRSSPGTAVLAAGWGLTAQHPDVYPLGLRAGRLEILRASACRAAFGADFAPAQQLCAVGPRGGRPDTCAGDSGGPLAAGQGAATVLIGIISYGSGTCGVSSDPGVYTRVSAVAGWVASVAGPLPAAPAGP